VADLTDEELARVEMYTTGGYVTGSCVGAIEIQRMTTELRRRRATDLSALERDALDWLRHHGEVVMAHRTGAAEGETDADGNELPGEWVPTRGAEALRVLDKLLGGGS